MTTITATLPMSEEPCPRCLQLAVEHEIRSETVLPLPVGAFAPRARDGSGKCCLDCAAADAIQAMGLHPNFVACRIAVGNERQEHLRLPIGARMGLVKAGLVRADPCGPKAFNKHIRWLETYVYPYMPSIPTGE